MADKKEIGALQNEVKEAASGLLDVTLYCQIAGAIVIFGWNCALPSSETSVGPGATECSECLTFLDVNWCCTCIPVFDIPVQVVLTPSLASVSVKLNTNVFVIK